MEKYLQFLVPYLRSRDQKCTFKNISSTSKNNIVEALESEVDIEASIDTLINTTKNNTSEPDIDCSENVGQNQPSTTETPLSFPRPGLKRKSVESNAFENSFVEYVNAKKKTLKQSEENPDLFF